MLRFLWEEECRGRSGDSQLQNELAEFFEAGRLEIYLHIGYGKRELKLSNLKSPKRFMFYEQSSPYRYFFYSITLYG
ncbi:hypothetical protein PC121_g5585 [Phytophthora cactorum]|nr:hypothetical protein PC121_g5585 [Phytophthora cactorum]